ncbi:hypothetical protein MNEG_4427 [Monoraphidium neglectum]|uniref:Serine aminopeptidase S33 domain-containing protein n=1 Tax=Monoraphidium neglectum TaxID=145388 RepID=A0A0D2NE72_9CHLO|nr:hypothetical protein MNEG_4427 [Monoraphidium neglectum]KIZ03536.1 hypothetical protein MNEG_4427 [Monoraphidium neglectum]|eukprot:XP_013902555.1 hypothetical protein MNEG_4427 [Monoraphidium neglectum]
MSMGALLNDRLPLWRAADELEVEILNPDPDYGPDYLADPLVVKGKIAVCTLHSILTAATLLKTPDAAARLAGVPLFFTACEGDRLTPAADLLQFVDLLREAGHDNLTLELLPGDRHDLLSGRDGPANAAGIAKFISKNI